MKRLILFTMIITFVFCSSVFSQEDGVQKEYYNSGKVHFERNYKNGQKDGLAREYYEDGTVKRQVNYVNGKMQGILKEYYPTGNLKATFEYKDDIPNGVVEKYYENGKLNHSKIYENGMPNSKGVKSFEYFDDGSLKYEYYYDKDEGGFSKTYHANGQVSLEVVIEGWNLYRCKNYNKEGDFISNKCPEE